MEKIWHTYYVLETIDKVVEDFRSKGLEVYYEPSKAKVPDPSAFIQPHVIADCRRWEKSELVPKEANTCISLLGHSKNFESLTTIVEASFTIVRRN